MSEREYKKAENQDKGAGDKTDSCETFDEEQVKLL
jgi:hypothetical protein